MVFFRKKNTSLKPITIHQIVRKENASHLIVSMMNKNPRFASRALKRIMVKHWLLKLKNRKLLIIKAGLTIKGRTFLCLGIFLFHVSKGMMRDLTKDEHSSFALKILQRSNRCLQKSIFLCECRFLLDEQITAILKRIMRLRKIDGFLRNIQKQCFGMKSLFGINSRGGRYE